MCAKLKSENGMERTIKKPVVKTLFAEALLHEQLNSCYKMYDGSSDGKHRRQISNGVITNLMRCVHFAITAICKTCEESFTVYYLISLPRVI